MRISDIPLLLSAYASLCKSRGDFSYELSDAWDLMAKPPFPSRMPGVYIITCYAPNRLPAEQNQNPVWGIGLAAKSGFRLRLTSRIGGRQPVSGAERPVFQSTSTSKSLPRCEDMFKPSLHPLRHASKLPNLYCGNDAEAKSIRRRIVHGDVGAYLIRVTSKNQQHTRSVEAFLFSLHCASTGFFPPLDSDI